MSTPNSHSDWWTPRELVEALKEEFFFDLDAAASAQNAISPNYISEKENALVYPWALFPCDCLHKMRSQTASNAGVLRTAFSQSQRPNIMVSGLLSSSGTDTDGTPAPDRTGESRTRKTEVSLQSKGHEVETSLFSGIQSQATCSTPSVSMEPRNVDDMPRLVGPHLRLLREEKVGGTGSRNFIVQSSVSGHGSVEYCPSVQEVQSSKQDQGPKCPYCGVFGKPARTVYVNPPYGKGYISTLPEFTKRAYEQSQEQHNTVVLLLPAYTDPKYWRDYCTKAHEIRFLTGRLAFLDRGESKMSARFPSALVIFKWFPGVCHKAPNQWVWDWRAV